MCTETTERDWVKEVGAPTYAGLQEMVAALQVDYDRLEELRDERDNYDPEEYGETVPAGGSAAEWWAKQFPGDAEELAALEEEAGDCNSEDDARQQIEEDPLSLRIFGERIDGEWEATSYELLLGTGGPATRNVGDLDDGYATSARLEVQDWFKPWTEYRPAGENVLMAYVGCFYFGE